MSENSTPPKENPNVPAIMGAPERDNETEEYVVLPNQPRPARNMMGLLRFAMEATAAEDAPAASNFQPLTEERRKFLEDTLKSMTVDIVEVLVKALETVKKFHEQDSDNGTEECAEALETIADIVDNVDYAIDFHKIGGFEVLVPCLTSSHISLQSQVAVLIGELAQNNPYCQSRILQFGCLPILLGLIDNGSTEELKAKALFAVSCLVRQCPEGLNEFVQLDGFSVLLRAIQSDCDKLRVKAAFIVGAVCTQHPEIKDDLQKMGWVQQLVGLISEEQLSAAHEQLLYALSALIKDHSQCIEDCRDPNLRLKSLLTEYIKSAQGREEYQDGLELARLIISMVFSEDSACGER